MTKKEVLQYVESHPSGRVKIAYADIDGILIALITAPLNK